MKSRIEDRESKMASILDHPSSILDPGTAREIK
jgi:hypothetical protein